MKDRIINKKWTNNRSTHLLIGFTIALFVVFSAFEWGTPITIDKPQKITFESPVHVEHVVRTTQRTVKRLPPVKKLKKKIEIKIPTELVSETIESDLEEWIDEYDAGEDFTGESFVESSPSEGKIEVQEKEKEEIFIIASRMPVFGDCRDIEEKDVRQACSEKALLTYIYDKVQFPSLARSNGITGTVYAEIIVGKSGEIQFKIVKSPAKILTQAVSTMLNDMPAWQAGMNNYRPVSVKFIIPVNFQLQ